MKHRLAVVVLLLSVVLTGCFAPKGFTPATPTTPSDSNFIIKINWQELDGLAPQPMRLMALAADSDGDGGNDGFESVTHIGARLVYPNEGASFTQSKERVAAEVEGVISMKVPPSKKAHLFVAAVQQADDFDDRYDNLLLYTGVLRDIVIEEETILVIEMDEIEWSRPTWQVVDEREWQDILAGEIEADMHRGRMRYDFWVSDPFQWDQPNIGWDTMLISAQGDRVGVVDTDPEAQTRIFTLICANPNQGQEGESECHVSPYLSGQAFNLNSSVGYFIKPVIEPFRILWR